MKQTTKKIASKAKTKTKKPIAKELLKIRNY